MKGAAFYFSGTGNTLYVAKLLKESFKKREVTLDLFSVENINTVEDKYDFYVFLGPIYAEFFPEILTNFIKEKVPFVKGKKAIIISTQAGGYAPTGLGSFSDILERKGFNIVLEHPIKMPNNYYVVAFKKPTNEDIKNAKEDAIKEAEYITKKFINGKKERKKISTLRKKSMYLIYILVNKSFKTWARKKLTVDIDKCINCNKCINECPTNNIYKENDKILFKNKCQSCMRCLHMCPVNAFKYKKKGFEQYKINRKYEIKN
ncbi:MAG: 4Fe-4S ferredoxin [Firmicutes bacterium]|nr:4Fe-4S ferredoxin [Bacillota bacterium]